MKKDNSFFRVLFILVMFLCVLFTLWYIPSVRMRRFILQDTQSKLESMQGQVRKQKYEYDQTVAALPDVLAELDRIKPLSEEKEEAVRTLKDERKRLRNEKKELTELAENAGRKEETDYE